MQNLKLNGQSFEFVIGQMSQGAKAGSLPSLFMANPQSDKELIQAFKSRNLSSGFWTAMMFDLTSQQVLKRKSELCIRPIQTKSELETWLALAETELMHGGKLNKRVFEQLMNHRDTRLYIGLKNNITVCTALLFIHEKTAGIYLVATDSKHRGQGFGSAITHHCMVESNIFGANIIYLQATHKGLSIYERLGFRNHGKIELFKIE